MATVNPQRLIRSMLSGSKHSSWVAALSDGEGRIEQIVHDGAKDSELLEAIVRSEHSMLAGHAPNVLVTRCRAPLGRYAHGLNLSCRRENGWRLLVTVLREESLGRFTEAQVEGMERSASALANGAAALFNVADTRAHVNLRGRTHPAFFVVDFDCTVEHSWLPHDKDLMLQVGSGTSRLAALIEGAVRELTATWRPNDPSTHLPGTAMPSTTLAVRVVPLSGPGGLRIGVTVETLRIRDTIGTATREFGLSPRELDVLALLLEGRDTPDVARALHIAPSTATHHVKRMLAKTRSRNRAELIARALGWQPGPDQ